MPEFIDELCTRGEAFGNTTIELGKHKALLLSIDLTVTMLTKLGVAVMVSSFAILLSVGVALLLSQWMGNWYAGFFVLAVFYLVAAIVMHFYLAHWLQTPVSRILIKKFVL